MFEKEAEEKTLKQGCSNIHYYYGFKDGANFGYNKAKEEIQELSPLLNFIIANREYLHFNHLYSNASDNERFNIHFQNILDKIETIIKE